MKKYRTTSLHPTLKEGIIFTTNTTIIAHQCDACAPFTPETLWICQKIVDTHPTWYEEVKPERWRAKDGDAFWYVQSWISVAESEESIGNLQSNFLFEKGNYFRTKEQAEEAAKRVHACLLAYQEEITK